LARATSEWGELGGQSYSRGKKSRKASSLGGKKRKAQKEKRPRLTKQTCKTVLAIN